MKKVRGNASWNGLSREKRATLMQWLFEERLSFNMALERAKTELGFTGSRTSLRRFYHRTRDERLLSGLTETGEVARTVEKSDVSVERLRNAGLKLAAEMFLRQVATSPENTKEWAPLAKLLLQAEKNDSWRRIKEEENGIRQRTLDFARVKYHYNVMAHAQQMLPELKELERANQDPTVTLLESNKAINDVRRGMFGEVLPDLLPETEEELAHPEIIVARFEEGKRQRSAQHAREYQERQREQQEQQRLREMEQIKVKLAAEPKKPAADRDEEGGSHWTETEEERERWAREDANDGARPEADDKEVAYYPREKGGGK